MPTSPAPQLIPRRVQLFGGVAIAWSVARADPAPALHGRGLVVLVLLVVGLAALVALPTPGTGRDRLESAALWALGLTGATLCWASPPSAGSALAFGACVAAGVRLPPLRLAVLVAGTVAVVAGAALVYDGSATGVAAYAAGFVATALLGVNRRQFVLRMEATELLLAREQRSREEQVRAAALDERARIARDVHDVLAHSLAGLTIQLDAAVLLLERSDPDGRPLRHVARAHGLAREGLQEAREAVGALRGDAVPLATGLEALVVDHRATGGTATLEVDGDPAALTADAAWALLRIAREAVTNVHKHAPGHAMAVRLAVTAADAELTVADRPLVVDGTAAPDGGAPGGGGTQAAAAGGDRGALAATGGGYGLLGMAERAEAIGGEVRAAPHGDGWRVVARIPLAAPDAEAPAADATSRPEGVA
ncbi:histidine kinase [Patulibacter sp. NPDC049589]|uniref:sensor histidine kinase n=1 Tax=Patulibacter sp. NPDC049589 TaxID=3154731 RepID=UPI003424974E